MASKFPIKIMAVTSKTTSAMDASYAELDKILDDNPLSEIVTVEDGGYMPDMTKAIKLQDAIYRVNVPGYFYHRVKDPEVAKGDMSAIILSCYPTLIDAYTGLWQLEHKCASSGGSGKSTANRAVRYWEQYYFIAEGENQTSLHIRKVDGTDLKTVNTTYCIPVGLRYAHSSTTAHRTVYAVLSGNSGDGGLSNNMIPIIPGRGSSKTLGGYSATLDTHDAFVRITNTQGGKNSGSTSTSDDGTTTKHSGYYTILGKETITGFTEGRGTYFFWSHPDNDNSEYYFIPAAGLSDRAKPLTRIRDVFLKFKPTITNGGELTLDLAMWHACYDAFDDHSDATWVLLKRKKDAPTSASALKTWDANELKPNKSKRTVPEFLYLNWTSGRYTKTKGVIAHPAYVGTTANQTIKPITTPFFALRTYKLPGITWGGLEAYPADSKQPTINRGSENAIGYLKLEAHGYRAIQKQYLRDLTLFYPTTDGVDTKQTISAKYTSQRDLAYE